MLQNLYIKNYALIRELDINFSEKLNIITGETGAGKSILLGALGLIMGNRADTKVLLHENDKCIVEANFNIAYYDLKDLHEEHDLEYQDLMNIRREISTTGKSRAYINDTLVTLDVLESFADLLIDIHLQFDLLEITKEKFQLDVIDALANQDVLLKTYKSQYKIYKSKSADLSKMKADQGQKNKDLEYNKFLLDEITIIKPEDEEYENLSSELEILTSTEDIKATCAQIAQGLDQGEFSVISVFTDLVRSSNSLASKDKRFAQITSRFTNLLEETKDLSNEVERINDETEYDQKRINFVQERIGLIHRLLKKHGLSSSEELLALQNTLSQAVATLSTMDLQIENLEKEVLGLEKELFSLAEKISKSRKSKVAEFCKSVKSILADLGMENAQFEINFETATNLTLRGIDVVTYLFSANKGMKLQGLKNAASGGEISRLSLVIKSLVAGAMALPTMIFDEIDTGVSGDVALKMGAILKTLSKKHQIISITHSPQVASKADLHLFVFKTEEENKTISNIKLLTYDEQIVEIAKMLSGNNPSEAAISNARDLISRT
jgi:DNA repair protein RecN (Recombination protein N)